MCDTLIATRSASANGTALFAKNSDRQPNEAQFLAQYPAQTHAAGGAVRCTYIEVPQAERTRAILLSQPYWMWGAEMGVNERGVTIGNEAVYSKIPPNKKPALLGMDMLRLALERADSAREAMEVMIDLLERFGQGGNCVAEGEMYYHNSFIIADANEAWVLETAGKKWAARQIEDSYSISNCLTLNEEISICSADLAASAESARRLNFAKEYSDSFYTFFGRGRRRASLTAEALRQEKATLAGMMKILRGHESDPQTGLFNVEVCMHAGLGPARISQSVASMVVHLDGDSPLIFVTGTSAPCASVFKPVWIDAGLPDLGPKPTRQYDPQTLFWAHERLHRAVLLNYQERLAAYAAERDALERRFIEGALRLKNAPARERRDFTAACFREAADAEAQWLKRVEQIPARRRFPHAQAWDQFNQKANMPPVK